MQTAFANAGLWAIYLCFFRRAYELSVLKVESIQPDGSCYFQEIDDGDDDPKTRVFLVPVTTNSDIVTVIADISPNIPEGDLPANMTLVGGDGSAKLTRTVSRTTPSKTIFTFNCCGSDSGLQTTLYVYDASIWLFADQGTRPWEWPWDFNVGHAWWGVNIDSFATGLIPDNLSPYINQLGGYWPTISGDPVCPGIVYFSTGAGGGHGATGFKQFHIKYDDLISALDYFRFMIDNQTTYSFFDHNCTDAAVTVGENGEVYTIDASGTLTSPRTLSDWLNSH